MLRAGLLAACGLLVAGLLWYALARPAAAAPFSLPELPGLLKAGDPRGVIGLGIVLLLLTPVARVAASLTHFAREGDRLYVGLTALVLASLGAAIALGAV